MYARSKAASRANRSRSPSRARTIVIVPMQGRRFSLDVLGGDTIDIVKAKIYERHRRASWSGVARSRVARSHGLVPELQSLWHQLPHYQIQLGNQDCGWLLFM